MCKNYLLVVLTAVVTVRQCATDELIDVRVFPSTEEETVAVSHLSPVSQPDRPAGTIIERAICSSGFLDFCRYYQVSRVSR